MNWFSILKVDIDLFVDSDEAYREIGSSQPLAIYNIPSDTIKVNLPNIARNLRQVLGREPTDEEIARVYTKLISHESGHAADVGFARLDEYFTNHESTHEDTEYVAYLTQFGNNVFNAIGRYLQHPSVKKRDPNDKSIFPNRILKDRYKNLLKLYQWVGQTASTNKLRNELILMELAVQKRFKGEAKTRFPINASMARQRYTDYNGKPLPKAGELINKIWGK